MSDGNSGENERRARIWAEMLAKVRAAYVRQGIGGIEPLVFGQYGELSESFEGLIDTLAVKGCDQAADHYLLDVGPGAASVQKRLLRQRVNCCVARAQAGVLLRRLKFALPGWAQAERRRTDWREQAAQRAAQARAY